MQKHAKPKSAPRLLYGGVQCDTPTLNSRRTVPANDSDYPTIADFVADLRAATPSNAAELAVPDMAELRESMLAWDIRSRQAIRKKISEYGSRLDAIASRRVMQSPMGYIHERRQALDHARERFVSAIEGSLARIHRRYVGCAAAMDAMSPLKVLARGYSIAEDKNGAIIKSSKQVNSGDAVRLKTADGVIPCTAD